MSNHVLAEDWLGRLMGVPAPWRVLRVGAPEGDAEGFVEIEVGHDGGLPAMLDALADYGAATGRRRADAAALGAVAPEDATPLVDSQGLAIVADARLDDPAQLREALRLKPRDGQIASARSSTNGGCPRISPVPGAASGAARSSGRC